MSVSSLKYKISITAFALAAIVVLATIKISVAGWKDVPQQNKLKVMKYDLMKRSYDLTIPSLKQSCADYDGLSRKLNVEIQSSNKISLMVLKEELLKVPDDSILLVLSKKIYQVGDYYEKKAEKGKRIVNLYNLNCEMPIIFIFEKLENNDYKMTDIKNLTDFFDCVYSNEFE